MTDWTSGYVTDINYTYGYYQELNPFRIPLAFANSGLASNGISHACELGYGQGLSTNIHAATSNVRWFGTDFNPDQAVFAQELAAKSGSEALLFDQSFEEFCSRNDLPDFDFIAMHGVWSWVSENNRKILVDFIKRKLKVGGVLYNAYNTQPGWASFMPVRDLMVQHGELSGHGRVGLVGKMDRAIEFARDLMNTNPKFIRGNPLVQKRLEKMAGQSKEYIAHEFFNKDWHPMPFYKASEFLKQAKLEFACSAQYLDQVDPINFTTEQREFLSGISDPTLRQSTIDLIVSQQFRRDYWVKGVRKLSSLERLERIRQTRIVLLNRPENIPLKVNGGQGEASLNPEIYQPVLDYLWQNQIVTIEQAENGLADTQVNLSQLHQAVMVLAGAGFIGFAQSEAAIEAAIPSTQKLNRAICENAKGSTDIAYLACPVNGGGLSVGRFQQLFLLAISEGLDSTEDWAGYAWNVLKSQGQLIVKKGTPLQSDEENLRELCLEASKFKDKGLELLKRLKVI